VKRIGIRFLKRDNPRIKACDKGSQSQQIVLGFGFAGYL
jgi:hypothetical protein